MLNRFHLFCLNVIFSNLINKYKPSIKKTWQVIKEALEKGQVNCQVSPKNVVNKKSITNKEVIAVNFNNFFTEVGPTLSQKIISSNKCFNDYMTSCDIFQPEKPVSINELKEAFFKNKQKCRV